MLFFLESIDFRRSTFSRDTDFKGSTFSEGAFFIESIFSGDIDFRGSTFGGNADFRGSTFGGGAYFVDSTFSRDSDFRGSTFIRKADFRGSTFSGGAFFIESTFSGNASFRGSTFSRSADFEGSTFNGRVVFTESTFGRYADFDRSTFSGGADFEGSTFSGNAFFRGSTFSRYAEFDGSTFSRYAEFDRSTFSGNTDFRGSTFSGDALTFKEAKFTKLLSQEDACRRAKNVLAKAGNREDEEYHFYRELEAKRILKGIRGDSGLGLGYLVLKTETWSFRKFFFYDGLEYIFVQKIFGYGVHPIWLFAWWLGFVLLFAVIYAIKSGIEEPEVRQWYDYFWFSVATAATPGYALYKPLGVFKFVAGIEAILGTFMWAAFITTFARKFMR